MHGMNSSIIIVLPKLEDAKKIHGILNRHGFSVAGVYNTAAHALAGVSELDGGIVISGCRLSDMSCVQLREYLTSTFELLVIGSERALAGVPESILKVQAPMKVLDLINTVEMVLAQQERRRKKERSKPKPRSWKEQNYINNAKRLLMERNHLSEEEAFRYIQKSSMDSGTNMVETAQMILMLMIYED